MPRLRDLDGISKLDAFRWDWHLIQPDPDNDLRDLATPENRAHIERLKDSLSIGWRQGESMLVRIEQESSTVYAVDGRCRLTALAELEAEGRPFPTKVTLLQEQSGTEPRKRMLAMLSSGTDRKNLSDAEFARGLYRAIELGYTEDELTAEMGWKTVTTLHNHLNVLTMKPELRKMVEDGKISRTEALRLSKMTDADPGEIMRSAEEEHKRLNKKGAPKIKPRHVRAATKKSEPPKLDLKPAPFVTEDETTAAQGKTPPEVLAERATEQSAIDAGPGDGIAPLSDETPPAEPYEAPPWSAPPDLVEPIKQAMAGTAEVHEQLQNAALRERPMPTVVPATGRGSVESLMGSMLSQSIDAGGLARMYGKLCQEHEEAAGQGNATDAQKQLCVYADVTGILRFPSEWEQAKASAEYTEAA